MHPAAVFSTVQPNPLWSCSERTSGPPFLPTPEGAGFPAAFSVKDPAFLTLDEVLALHADQIERYGGSPGVRDACFA